MAGSAWPAFGDAEEERSEPPEPASAQHDAQRNGHGEDDDRRQERDLQLLNRRSDDVVAVQGALLDAVEFGVGDPQVVRRLSIDLARSVGVPAELSALVEQVYRRARASYGDRAGEMTPFKLYEDLIGHELRLTH